MTTRLRMTRAFGLEARSDMDAREQQELYQLLRDMRASLDVPPPKDADLARRVGHLEFLVGKTRVVLDSALVTLST